MDFSIILNTVAFRNYPESEGWGPNGIVVFVLFYIVIIMNDDAPTH